MADISDIATMFTNSAASFNFTLPAKTVRIVIWAEGLLPPSLFVESGGTAFEIPLNEEIILHGKDLGGRKVYFTTQAGENVYLLAEKEL